MSELSISQGAASTTLKQLIEWGAVQSSFDTDRRCQMHSPVGNTLSIVATVLRRREQVAFGHFHSGMSQTLKHVNAKFGSKDPRVLTLRSILSTFEIADAVMQLVFTSVSGALGDPQSMLSRTIQAALKFGIGMDGKKLASIPEHAIEPQSPEIPASGEDRQIG